MKIISLGLSIFLAVSSACFAAPVESTSSSRAVALQKVDAFFHEQAVAAQLATLGLSKAEINTRLAALSDAQLAALAAEVDLLQAGGMIQGGNPNPSGVLGCIFRPIGRFFYNLYQLIFCWGSLNVD